MAIELGRPVPQAMPLGAGEGVDLLGASGWSGDIGDVALAMALLQIESLDGEIRSRIGTSQAINKVREAYRERLGQLNDALAHAKDGKVWLPSELAFVVDYESETTTRGVEVVTRVRGRNGVGGAVGTEVDPSELDRVAGGQTPLTREEVEAEIDRIKSKLETLGSQSEIEMLHLNRQLGRRNQILQMTSNVLSSTHQSAMGIIANLKV